MGTFAIPLTLLCTLSGGIDAKIASMLPTPEEETWLKIPWRTHLTQARKEAYVSKKPLFIWMMNGHPMGCT